MKKRHFLGIISGALGAPRNLLAEEPTPGATQYRHPGVYIQEINQPSPVQAVTTSTVGFVGITEKGVAPRSTDPGLYNVPMVITSWYQFVETYGGIIWNRHLATAVWAFFRNGGTLCFIVRVEEEGGLAGTATIPGLGTIHATSTGDSSVPLSIEIANSPTGASAETPSFTLKVVYTPDPNIPSERYEDFISDNRIPKSESKYVLESFEGLVVPPNVDNSHPDKIARAMAPIVDRIAGESLFIRLVPDSKVAPSRPANSGANPTPITGGKNGKVDYGSAGSDPRGNKGFHAFDSLAGDAVNVMAIPDLPTLADKNGVIDEAAQAKVIRAAANYCEKKGSMFFIADPPSGLSPTEITEYRQGTKTKLPLTTDFGAIYYPWFMMQEPGSARFITVPPSGAVAGVYAETDMMTGVWKAPAGTQAQIRVALDLERQVTDAEQDLLNPVGINAIRQFPALGTLVWGARTLSSDPAWTYINVRRLVTYIERSIERGTWWVVFETSSPKLWRTVERNISFFLTTQWQQGALSGATASEAFFVKIDADNNPAELQNVGQLQIEVGVAPVFPAEFVVLNFRLNTLSSK